MKFIVFEEEGKAGFAQSSGWCKLTVDQDLKKYFDFFCYEFNGKTPILPEQYNFVLGEETPFFVVETETEVLALGTLEGHRSFEQLKLALLKVATESR